MRHWKSSSRRTSSPMANTPACRGHLRRTSTRRRHPCQARGARVHGAVCRKIAGVHRTRQGRGRNRPRRECQGRRDVVRCHDPGPGGAVPGLGKQGNLLGERRLEEVRRACGCAYTIGNKFMNQGDLLLLLDRHHNLAEILTVYENRLGGFRFSYRQCSVNHHLNLARRQSWPQ